MANTLTSELNSTIQRDTTTLDAGLEETLVGLEEGVYQVGGGSLTVEVTDEVLDTVTGKYNNLSSLITSTDWFTGTEVAGQELYDLVTGLAQTGVYFAFDTDTVQFNSGPRTTVDCLYWDGDSVETRSFRAVEDVSYATSYVAPSTTYTWDTNKGFLEGLELVGSDITLVVV